MMSKGLNRLIGSIVDEEVEVVARVGLSLDVVDENIDCFEDLPLAGRSELLPDIESLNQDSQVVWLDNFYHSVVVCANGDEVGHNGDSLISGTDPWVVDSLMNNLIHESFSLEKEQALMVRACCYVGQDPKGLLNDLVVLLVRKHLVDGGQEVIEQDHVDDFVVLYRGHLTSYAQSLMDFTFLDTGKLLYDQADEVDVSRDSLFKVAVVLLKADVVEGMPQFGVAFIGDESSLVIEQEQNIDDLDLLIMSQVVGLVEPLRDLI